MIPFFLSNFLAPCTVYSSNHKVLNVHFVMFLFPAIFAPRIFFSLNHNVIQIIVFQVTREVERRIEDLTHQVHREILTRSVDQVKTLAPILICSMKIFIQIVLQGSWYIFLLKRKRLPVWGHKDGTAKIILSLFKRIFILKLWSTSYSSSKPIKIFCHNKAPLFFFNETIQFWVRFGYIVSAIRLWGILSRFQFVSYNKSRHV